MFPLSASGRENLTLEKPKQIYEKLYGWKIQKEESRQKPSFDTEFSQEKLAKELNVSREKVSKDLQIAEAIKKYPEIGECRKKTEALRKLRKIKKEKIVRKVKSKMPSNVPLIEEASERLILLDLTSCLLKKN